MQWTALNRQALDCRHLVVLGLDSEHQAGTYGHAVEQHGAAPAHAVLATDVSAGQAEVMAEVVRKQAAWISRRRMDDAVDLHAANSLSVRPRTRCRRSSGVASRSPLGRRPRGGSRGSARRGGAATPNKASRSAALTMPAGA